MATQATTGAVSVLDRPVTAVDVGGMWVPAGIGAPVDYSALTRGELEELRAVSGRWLERALEACPLTGTMADARQLPAELAIIHGEISAARFFRGDAVAWQVTETYRNAAGVYAVRVDYADGQACTVRLDRGQLSWAKEDVWDYANRERYSLTWWTCPGHGPSRICPYGTHDEVRFAGDLAALRAAGEAL